jgi:hypothetical protein
MLQQGACDDQPPTGNERTDYLTQDGIDVLDAVHFIDILETELEGEFPDEADPTACDAHSVKPWGIVGSQ